MRSDDPKALVKRKLKRFFEVISDQAAENPEFLAALERALGSHRESDQENLAAERATPGKRASGPNLLEVLHSEGELALQDLVNSLPNDELIKLVAQEGLRKMKEAKALDRTDLINLLLDMAQKRLEQGSSFVRRND